MQPTIPCGKQLAEHADLSGSRFHDVNLTGTEFNDVNLSRARFHNINLSDVTVSAAQMGGVRFKHIGLPPGSKGKQRPLHFEEADLNGSTISKCDLSGVRIERCYIAGMTIDGVLVTDLLAEHKRRDPS